MANGLAVKLLGDPQDADDVVQVVFSRLHFGALERWDPEQGSLPTFIAHITKQACIDVLRKREREPEFVALELPWDDEDDDAADYRDTPGHEVPLDEALEAKDSRAFLHRLMRSLSPSDNDLLRRKFFWSQGRRAMAAELNLEPGTLDKRVQRAIERLRKSIK